MFPNSQKTLEVLKLGLGARDGLPPAEYHRNLAKDHFLERAVISYQNHQLSFRHEFLIDGWFLGSQNFF